LVGARHKELPAGDVAAGFWLLEVGSRVDAAEWGGRVPRGDVEIREDAWCLPRRASGARQSNTTRSR
jgi:hypothetical protein